MGSHFCTDFESTCPWPFFPLLVGLLTENLNVDRHSLDDNECNINVLICLCFVPLHVFTYMCALILSVCIYIRISINIHLNINI